MLAEHCLECHGEEKSKGGLRLDVAASMLKGGDSGPAVVPGKPEESALIEAIRYEGDVQMPPKGKLKDAEIAALTDWVKRGAHWPSPARARIEAAPDRPRPRHTAPPIHRPPHRAGPIVLVVPAGRQSRAARRAATRPGRPRRSTGSSSPASRPPAWRRRRRPTRRP